MIDPSQLENIDFEKLMSLLGNDFFHLSLITYIIMRIKII